jgi:hypothetical protein
MRFPALSCVYIIGLAATLVAQAPPLPSGTQVQVRLGQTISSDKARSGDTWSGTLASDLRVDGNTVGRRGDPVQGRVAEAKASGRLEGTAVLELQLTSINGNPVNTETLSSQGGSHKGRNTKAVGGTAVAGAIIGAIAGGGKGAAIGAGAGAGAGAAGAAAGGKKDVRYPVETVLTFVIR